MSYASLCAAGDSFLDRTQTIVCDDSIHMAGLDQAILDDVSIEFTASDQLKEYERGAVECDIVPGTAAASAATSASSAAATYAPRKDKCVAWIRARSDIGGFLRVRATSHSGATATGAAGSVNHSYRRPFS